MKKNILISGGDKRQLSVAKNLSQSGFEVEIFGFSEEMNSGFRKTSSLKDAMEKADIIVLPMPLTKDGETLNAPLNDSPVLIKDICMYLDETKKVYGGLVGNLISKKGVSVTDYALIEDLILKNAVLSAEGALGIIISSTPFSIYNTRILITGYGRIGKLLADYIKALGGIPVVCARKETDFAWCGIKGIRYIGYEDLKKTLGKFKVIINTVPHKVLSKDVLENISSDSFVLDLASNGGGVDFESLDKKEIKYIHALGIPGKYSPIEAGKIISDIIIKREKD